MSVPVRKPPDPFGSSTSTWSRAVPALERHHWLAALLTYLLIVLCLSNNLLLHLNDRILGPSAEGDNAWYAWSMWDFHRAINAGQDPAHTHSIFALLPSVQIFIDGFFDYGLGWLLQFFTGPLAAYNVVLLLSFVLSGFTMYLLIGEFVASRTAAFIGGFLYDFSTFHFAHAAGHMGLTTMEWLPFCAWRAFAFYRRPTFTNAALAGLAVALVPLSEIYFLAYFGIPFLLLFVVGVLLVNHRWVLQRRHILLSGLVVLLAVAIAGPPLGDYFRVDSDVQSTATLYAAGSLAPLSADALALVLPFMSNPVLGALTARTYASMQSPYPVEEAVFLGYPAIFLGVLAFAFRRSRTRAAVFWAVVAGVGILLALGPELLVAGHSISPLPFYRLVFGWPVLSTFRVPSRLAVLPLMALCVLAASAVDALIAAFGEAVRGRVLLTVAGVVLLAVALTTQTVWSVEDLAASSLPVPSPYREIAADTRPNLLLDVPIMPVGLYEYYQTIHHKLLVAGYAPRVSDRMTNSVFDVPYLSAMDGSAPLELEQAIARQGDIYRPSGGFRAALRDRGITYVVLHPRMLDATTLSWMRAFLQRSLGPPFSSNEQEGTVAWALGSGPNLDSVHLSLGSGWLPGVQLYRSYLMRTVAQDGQLMVDVPRTERLSLRFRARAVFEPLTMTVRVNNVAQQSISFPQAGPDRVVELGNVPFHHGRNVVEIHASPGCTRPHDLDPNSPDTRCFSFSVQQVALQ